MEHAGSVASALAVIALGSVGTVNSVLNAALGAAAAAGTSGCGADLAGPDADQNSNCPPGQHALYKGTMLAGATAVYCLLVPLLGVIAVVAVVAKGRLTKVGSFREQGRAYHWLGGVCGVIGMMAAIICTPRLGAVIYFAINILGALTASMLLDAIGFAGVQKRALHFVKVFAAVVALSGVIATSVASALPNKLTAMTENRNGSDVGHYCRTSGCVEQLAPSVASRLQQLPGTGEQAAPEQPIAIPAGIMAACGILTFLGGVLHPVQALLNWRLGHVLAHKSLALVWSAATALALSLAVVGMFLAGAAAATDSIAPSGSSSAPLEGVASGIVAASLAGISEGTHARPWIWGGAVGAVLTFAGSVIFPRRIGASAYFVLLLCGELFSSLVLDHIGGLGLPVRRATAGRAAGVCVVLLAAMLMRYADELRVLILTRMGRDASLSSDDGGPEVTKASSSDAGETAAETGHTPTPYSSPHEEGVPVVDIGHHVRLRSDGSARSLTTGRPLAMSGVRRSISRIASMPAAFTGQWPWANLRAQQPFATTTTPVWKEHSYDSRSGTRSDSDSIRDAAVGLSRDRDSSGTGQRDDTSGSHLELRLYRDDRSVDRSYVHGPQGIQTLSTTGQSGVKPSGFVWPGPAAADGHGHGASAPARPDGPANDVSSAASPQAQQRSISSSQLDRLRALSLSLGQGGDRRPNVTWADNVANPALEPLLGTGQRLRARSRQMSSLDAMADALVSDCDDIEF